MKHEVTKEQMALIADYASIFGTDSGKRVMKDLKESFCARCYSKGDPYDSSFRLGQRDVVMKMMGMIKMSELPLEVVEELTSEI